MICGYCAVEFVPDKSQSACSTCPVSKASGGCGRARCPRCGWENVEVEVPKFVQRFREWRKRHHASVE